MNKTIIWTGLTTASLFVHVAAFGGFSQQPRSDGFGGKPKRPPTLVEMSVAKLAPPAPAAPTPAKAAAKPAHRLAIANRPRATTAPSAAPPPSAPTEAETPADFTGTTLTNDGPGPGWASATGNGQAMRGPVGTPGAKVTGRSVAGSGDGAPVVGVGDLSQAPQAPDLASMLERFYPADARKKGLTGKAVLRARVMPDGQVREMSLVSESGAGFGDACRQTLRGSRWSPPLDRNGAAVSTYIHYACRFEVH